MGLALNMYLLLGVLCFVSGVLLWLRQEESHALLNGWVIASVVLLILGAFNILRGLLIQLKAWSPEMTSMEATVKDVKLWDRVFIYGLIFVGAMMYTLAAYMHLKLHKWSFLAAFALALPMVLIEYQFSLRGNHYAHEILNLNTVQIALITMVFYFINSWILNHFVLKHTVVWWRELTAFVLIMAAFVVIHRQ